MGKAAKDQDDESMDNQEPQDHKLNVAKTKTIKKNKVKSEQTYEQPQHKTHKIRNIQNQAIKKFSNLVNLKKQRIPQEQKRNILTKVLGSMKGTKKVARRHQKKQRLQIKKSLRQQLQSKLVPKHSATLSTTQAMSQQKSVLKKQKFDAVKQASVFKKHMGLGFGDLKKVLAQKQSS